MLKPSRIIFLWFVTLPLLLLFQTMFFSFSDFLNVPLISDSDVKQAVQCLSPSKYVRPDEIPSFIIKGFSQIFSPSFESHF
jgi:hypothetical protein